MSLAQGEARLMEPKHELPVTAPGQDGPWPNNLQLPIQTRRIIDASQNFFDTTVNPDAAGDQVVNYYSASIGNFVATQRRDYASGINQQQNRFFTLPGLAMRYENNQGMERLTLVAQPESFVSGGNQVLDTNLDGYIVWVHSEVGYPNLINFEPTIGGPYDIFLNGYKIYEGFKITQENSAFVIMFGLTALRCHSLEDKTNPLLTNTSYGPTALGNASVNDIIPPRKDIAASNAPDGAVVPRHKDEPLYPIFNWNDALNPCTLISTGGTGSYTRWEIFIGSSATPQVTNGVHFKDPMKSPLVKDGPNFITVLLQPGASAPELLSISIIFAEFYDRKTTDVVQQSWNYNSIPGQAIIANDKPLYFGCVEVNGGSFLSLSTGFDLTKGATNSQDDCLLSGLDDALTGESASLVGLTATQQAAITAYTAEVRAIFAAFNASQAPIIAALTTEVEAAFALYLNAYKLALVGRYLAADTKRYETYFPDYDQYYDPTPDIPDSVIKYANPVQDDPTNLVTEVTEVSSGGVNTFSIVYGPQQGYYLDLTVPFNALIGTLLNPYVTMVQPEYITVPGSEYGSTTGGTGGLPTTIIQGQSYEQDTTYSFLSSPANYIGPAQPSVLLELIDAYVSTNAPPYNIALMELEAATIATPTLPPIPPDAGMSIDPFVWRTVDVTGDDWLFGEWTNP